jgi:class 3 adenylate cyclase
MREAFERFADGARRSTVVPLQMRVGLNSGEVVVRSIGSDLRMDYSAVGRTTHLAARMEQLATPGSILIAPRDPGARRGVHPRAGARTDGSQGARQPDRGV